VARTEKHGRKKSREVPEVKLLETIVEGVIKAKAMSFEEWWGQETTKPFVPMAIPVSEEGQYRVTQEGVNAAHQLTKQTWSARQDLQQTISRRSFDQLSFTAIGDAIRNSPAHIPSDPPKSWVPDGVFFSAVAADYRTNLDQLAGRARQDLDRHIPCHLFDADQGVAPFSLGPVQFLPRSDWIARYVTDPTQLAHIRDVETGVTTAEVFRSRVLQPGSGSDFHAAWRILQFLGSFGWVGTLRMSGHELNQSHYKASIVVGLAIDAVGLRFQVEDARRFTKAGRQHLFGEARLATDPAGRILSGSSAQMPGLGAAPGKLAAKMLAERPFLDAAGTVLETYVTGRQGGRAPHLVERWANALYWVGEARREATDFMAVVKYGCAADGLSGAGGNSAKMIEFAEAALNPKAQPNPPGTLGIADAVNRVYGEGRNKLAHGEISGLLEDLAETRAIGDDLLGILFDVITMELADIIHNRIQIFQISEEHAYRALQARLKMRP
jgi:hypothetical protein